MDLWIQGSAWCNCNTSKELVWGNFDYRLLRSDQTPSDQETQEYFMSVSNGWLVWCKRENATMDTPVHSLRPILQNYSVKRKSMVQNLCVHYCVPIRRSFLGHRGKFNCSIDPVLAISRIPSRQPALHSLGLRRGRSPPVLLMKIHLVAI